MRKKFQHYSLLSLFAVATMFGCATLTQEQVDLAFSIADNAMARLDEYGILDSILDEDDHAAVEENLRDIALEWVRQPGNLEEVINRIDEFIANLPSYQPQAATVKAAGAYKALTTESADALRALFPVAETQ